MGNVVSAGVGQNPARKAAIHGRLADHVAALTITKVEFMNAEIPYDGSKQLLPENDRATFQALIALLSANNIPLEQVKLVDVGFGVAPLLVGQVDALMGFTTSETVEAESAGMQINVMPISGFGVDVYGLTIVGNSSLIERSRNW
jgi:hypothetical protein